MFNVEVISDVEYDEFPGRGFTTGSVDLEAAAFGRVLRHTHQRRSSCQPAAGYETVDIKTNSD